MDEYKQRIADQSNDRISLLLSWHACGVEMSEEERSELNQWVLADARNRELFETFSGGVELSEALAAFTQPDTETALGRLRARIDDPESLVEHKPNHLLRWIPYAAAVLLVASFVSYFSMTTQQPDRVQSVERVEDVEPGGYRAVLQLADGRTISLDESQKGIIVGDGNIAYQDGSSLHDVPKEGTQGKGAPHLELSTPKGGTYQITLPDGTEVWLNASSTLKYPTVFNQDERTVEVVGEAYFAVAKDQTRPFRVVSDGQTVEVLGTEFNISAYPDDTAMKTTLVEGKIALSLADGSRSPVILHPGQQASRQGTAFAIQEVDVFDYTSWKEGIIVLNSARLPDVVRQLERWYDVSFEFSDTGTEKTAYVLINRNENLSSVLKALEETYHVELKLEERRVRIID